MTKTLLGGPPDCNRRSIVDSWNEFETVAYFNYGMNEWTSVDQRRLDICLEALNESAKGHARDRPQEDYDGPSPDIAPQD